MLLACHVLKHFEVNDCQVNIYIKHKNQHENIKKLNNRDIKKPSNLEVMSSNHRCVKEIPGFYPALTRQRFQVVIHFL